MFIIFSKLVLLRLTNKNIFYFINHRIRGDFSCEGSGTLPQNSYKLGPIRNYPVKESHIGSTVSKILRNCRVATHIKYLLYVWTCINQTLIIEYLKLQIKRMAIFTNNQGRLRSIVPLDISVIKSYFRRVVVFESRPTRHTRDVEKSSKLT